MGGSKYNFEAPNFKERFGSLQYSQSPYYNASILSGSFNISTPVLGPFKDTAQAYNDVKSMKYESPFQTKSTQSKAYKTYEDLNKDFGNIKDTKELAGNLRQVKPEQVQLGNNIKASSAQGSTSASQSASTAANVTSSGGEGPSAFKKAMGKVGQGINSFMNSKGAKYGMQTFDFAMNFMGDNDKDINSWDKQTKQIRNGIANGMVASGNPWLMAAGLAVKGLGKLGAFGDATKGLGAGNDILNTLGAFTPGVGWIAKKSKEIQKDLAVQSSSGYGGVTSDVDKAAQNAGGKFLFGMNKQNQRRDAANFAQSLASDILADNKFAIQSSNNPLYQQRSSLLTSGGYNAMSYAKEGCKLYNLAEARRILNNRMQMFKEGGAVNVIPDGALHKNRHHLEDIDKKFEDVTTKGIPVITEAKNGDIIQQAEVEKEEIIFNLSVTKKLEELMEKGTDEAAIEAGKLLTEEILRNTIDNTNKLL